jgi:hypothetical protein
MNTVLNERLIYTKEYAYIIKEIEEVTLIQVTPISVYYCVRILSLITDLM